MRYLRRNYDDSPSGYKLSHNPTGLLIKELISRFEGCNKRTRNIKK